MKIRPSYFNLISSGLFLASLNLLHAQYGVQPSNNSNYFDELRSRAVYHSYQRANPNINQQAVEKESYQAKGSKQVGTINTGPGYGGGAPQNNPYYPTNASEWNESKNYALGYGGRVPSYFGNTPPLGNSHAQSTRNSFFRYGPISLTMGTSAYFSAEYNDNIGQTKSNKQSDTILAFGFNVQGNVGITRYSQLNYGFGIGFEHYVDQGDLNGDDDFYFNVFPNSIISHDFMIGDVYFNIHNRTTVSNNLSQDYFSLDAEDFYDKIQNSTGVAAYWPINSSLNLTAGYNYSFDVSLEDDGFMDDRNRNSHNVNASISFSPRQTWAIGVETSAAFTKVEDNTLNDSNSYSVGSFLRMPLSHYSSFSAGVGYQNIDSKNTASIGDSSDYGSYYYYVNLQNQLNSYVAHSLSAGHEANLGNSSNHVESDYARYAIDLQTDVGLAFSAGAYYSKDKDSGGELSEEAEQYGFDVRTGYQLTKDVSFSAGYSYSNTESNLENRDYKQHRLDLSFYYLLAQDLTMRLGYQFWKVDSEDSEIKESFDQNRVYLDLNYNF